MKDTPRAKPLDGVRITDFTLHQAGPYGTHFLSVLGAECIMIETAGRPDTHRRAHPVYGRLEPCEFDQAHANKLGITLNLKTPQGRDLAKRLVSLSHVAAESFRPGVMDRLGLSYEVLSALRRDLVMVSLSASGQVGPESSEPGYAPIFSALGGLGYLTGYADGPPVEIRNTMDNVTGLTMSYAVLVGLYKARRTGIGEHIDLAAREVASCFIGDAIAASSMGVQIARCGNEMPYRAPHGIYPCRGRDEWISISVGDDIEWSALCVVLGQRDWTMHPSFTDTNRRWLNRLLLDKLVAERTASEEVWDLTARLQAAGLSAFKSVTARDIAEDRHLRSRGTVKEMTHHSGRTRAIVGSPWRFTATPVEVETWTPDLGEHNDYVFGDLLGLSASAIKELTSDGVIG